MMETTRRRPRSAGKLALYLQGCERQLLLAELRKHQGHNSNTAKALGISRRALYDKLRTYGLDQEAAGMRVEGGVRGPRKVEQAEG